MPEKIDRNTVYELVIDETLANERLDVAITALCPDLSRTRVQKLIHDGLVTIGGRTELAPRDKYSAGTKITVIDPPPEVPDKAEAEDIPLDVLYEDDEVLVINKPAGMVVHPAAGNWHGTIVNAVLGREPGLDDEDLDPMRPGIVHRLDKDTSGALVIAKTAKALRKLSKSFANREVNKTYLAIVHGWPMPKVNVVNLPIARHKTDRRKMTVVRRGEGREALTSWRVVRNGVWEGKKVSVMELQLHTGRTHQIRVHMSHLDYPLVGEKLYNKGRSSTAERQMLHARRISFPHPETKEMMTFEAPIPSDFQAIMDAMQAE